VSGGGLGQLHGQDLADLAVQHFQCALADGQQFGAQFDGGLEAADPLQETEHQVHSPRAVEQAQEPGPDLFLAQEPVDRQHQPGADP
jgi:hypothetical protein